ncbi:MAG: adenylate/guanylate cyclase domain-containing protein, partial [Chthoniobacterales bacterium]
MTDDVPPAIGPATKGGLFHLMFLRVSPEDFIIYANSALADYIGVQKDVILGAPFEEFRKRLSGELLECFQRPERGRGSNRMVTDEAGRVFEARTYSETGVLDVVLNEVTHAEATFGDLLRSTGTPIENLTEEEIRILRQADRRFATVSVAQMRGLGAVAGRLPPHEMQLMLDAFAEEMSECILTTGSTVGQMTGDTVTGIFGSPRYHRDHALRAVTSACLQIDRIAKLHDAFSKQGRELPPCSIALATGEMLIAVIETAARRACNAIGETVEHAGVLAQVARPGEVVLTEETLKEILVTLPEGWEYVRADTETEADLSDFKWDGVEVEPLPPSLRKIAYLIGPGVKSDASRTELYFDYLYAIPDRATGH